MINCPGDRRQELAAFYASLFGEDRWRIPRLVFGEGLDHPPVWGDGERPQQLHLEAEVRDIDAVAEGVTSNGGTLMEETADRRTYADPVGHAVTVIGSATRSDGALPVLARVVIDCSDPSGLASFHQELLSMPTRVDEPPDRLVIASDDGRPELAFVRVAPYVAPRWPDPAFPAQMHFDLKFYDRVAATALVEGLGATRLPDGGSCPVYADPAGHPFCLCMHGQ